MTYVPTRSPGTGTVALNAMRLEINFPPKKKRDMTTLENTSITTFPPATNEGGAELNAAEIVVIVVFPACVVIVAVLVFLFGQGVLKKYFCKDSTSLPPAQPVNISVRLLPTEPSDQPIMSSDERQGSVTDATPLPLQPSDQPDNSSDDSSESGATGNNSYSQSRQQSQPSLSDFPSLYGDIHLHVKDAPVFLNSVVRGCSFISDDNSDRRQRQSDHPDGNFSSTREAENEPFTDDNSDRRQRQSDQPDGRFSSTHEAGMSASSNRRENVKFQVLDNNAGKKCTVSTTRFKKGDFLMNYDGELISHEDAIRQQEIDHESEAKFLFFQHEGKSLCVKTTDSHGACKFVNHARSIEANTEIQITLSDEGTPHLLLHALKDIQPRDELRCSYVQWHKQVQNSRWKENLLKLDKTKKDECKQVGSVHYSKSLVIAEGSIGSVIYLGLLDDLPVAVKRMNSNKVGKEIDIYEALKNKKLKHVLKTLCVEKDDDFTYLITDLCEYNLEKFIEESKKGKRKLGEKGLYQLCVEFMEGLQELHDLNILHRDIKPANVLLDNNGNVLIGDCGISRKITDQTTKFTEAYGTLCWMSLESLQPSSDTNKARYKKASDVQVAGSLIYYILSGGHIPHENTFPYRNEPEGVTKNVKEGNFTLDHLGTFSSSSLDALLQDMLSSNINRRPKIEDCLTRFQECFPTLVS